MPVGLAEITLPPKMEGLVFKAPKKATLPEQWFTTGYEATT